MGQVALQYARRGWPVFPCRERDSETTNAAGKVIKFHAKAPYTGTGLKEATCDERRIIAWWRQHPNAMIGVPTGVNGCFVLDFDPRMIEDVDPETGEVLGERMSGLEELKAALEAQMGVPLPQSLTSLTQSGGVHVWFKQPRDGGDEIRNRGNLPDHVDVRGMGGYVIAPPSVTLDEAGQEKGRYSWKRDRGDWRDDGDVAEAPAELIEILRTRGGKRKAERAAAAPVAKTQAGRVGAPSPVATLQAVDEDLRRYALRALDGECQSIRTARSPGRNDQLNVSSFSIATLAAAGVLDATVARASIEAAARDNPGDDDAHQLEATINSGWTAGLNSPRDLSEIATASRSRRERGQRSPSRPAAPRQAAAKMNEPFRGGREEGLSALQGAERARLKRAAASWLKRRIEHADRTPQAFERIAYGAGRRASAGLIDLDEARAAIWEAGEPVADLQPDAIDGALEDGFNRGFDIQAQLLHLRCAGYPLTDFGIGERFRARFGDEFFFTTAKGWLGWDGKRWQVLDQEKDHPPAELIGAVFETVRLIQDEAHMIRDTGVRWELMGSDKDRRLDLEDLNNPHGLDRWIPKGRQWERLSDKIAAFGRTSECAGKPGAIAMLGRRWLTRPIESFDRDPLGVNVLNGTLRFQRETMPDGARVASVRLEPHRREDLNTKLAPVTYDPRAESPIYDGFMLWAHPKEETRRYLHAAVGYGMSGDTGEQKLWFHYGRGANGKSTAMDLWADVAGDYSGTIGIETFLDQGIKKRGEQASPDLARLGGVRFLRASEPERGSRLNEALIKAATGGEPMAVRALHRGFFDLRPLFKLHIGGNYKPDIPGTDEGIWRRMKLVPWNAHVAQADRDETLPAKLRGELSGVLNRLVAGLLDWLENGLIEPADVIEATAEYREDSDPLARFLMLCTEMDPQSRIQSSKLHGVFVAWCKAAGEKEWTNKGFSKAMSDKGFSKKASDGMQWIGIRLVKAASDFVNPETGAVVDLSAPSLTDGQPPPGDDDPFTWVRDSGDVP